MKASDKWTFDGNSVLDSKGRNVCTKPNGAKIAALPELIEASKAFLNQTSVGNRAALRSILAIAEGLPLVGPSGGEPITILRRVTPKQTPFSNGVKAIRKAVLLAYGDAHPSGNHTARNLDFRASASVSRDEAIAILKEAITNGCNEFEPELLEKLPPDARVTIAREGSVCVYVNGTIPTDSDYRDSLKADELDYYPAKNETRIWWD